jgi:hypothetical protein
MENFDPYRSIEDNVKDKPIKNNFAKKNDDSICVKGGGARYCVQILPKIQKTKTVQLASYSLRFKI